MPLCCSCLANHLSKGRNLGLSRHRAGRSECREQKRHVRLARPALRCCASLSTAADRPAACRAASSSVWGQGKRGQVSDDIAFGHACNGDACLGLLCLQLCLPCCGGLRFQFRLRCQGRRSGPSVLRSLPAAALTPSLALSRSSSCWLPAAAARPCCPSSCCSRVLSARLSSRARSRRRSKSLSKPCAAGVVKPEDARGRGGGRWE